jgi:hypothetical protein
MPQNINFQQLFTTQEITNAAASYYTVPTRQAAKIQKLVAANNGAGAETIKVWIGPTATDAYLICPLCTIPPNSRGVDIFEAEGLIMAAADQIWLQASNNSVITAACSGAVLT